MNSKRKHGKIKGFTLVEMIVVMAIIVILAGIGSLGVTAFVRNARKETANDNAHLMFTAFQNMLIQCEIKQDQSLLDIDHTKGNLEHAVVTFQMHDASFNNALTVRCKYKGSAAEATDTWSKGSTESVPGATGVTKGDKYEALVKSIATNIDNTFTGTMRVYIDYDNFEVKSVIFQDWNSNNITFNMVAEDNYVKYDDWYYGLNNRIEQGTLCEGKQVAGTAHGPDKLFTCGVYPYHDEID